MKPLKVGKKVMPIKRGARRGGGTSLVEVSFHISYARSWIVSNFCVTQEVVQCHDSGSSRPKKRERREISR